LIELENLAAWTVPAQSQQDFTSRVGIFPAGSLAVEMGGTFLVYIFGATQNSPARIFPFPEVLQLLSPYLCGHILYDFHKKST